MLGILPFIFEIATVLFYLLLGLKLFSAWLKSPKNLHTITRLLGGLVITGAAIFFAHRIFIPQFTSYLFLKALNPNEVDSITINNVSFTDNSEIQRVTNSLNQAVWHIPNHDSGGPFVDMTVSLHSGSTLAFRIGRYNDKDAALVGQVFTRNSQIVLAQELYIPALPTTLESLNYSLPPAEIGYTTEPKDYLFLWLFMGIYVVVLWPRKAQKKRLKSGPTQRAPDGWDSPR
jgi:hypothetical protein